MESQRAIKRVYALIAGSPATAFDFYVTAQGLQAYLSKRATVEPDYAYKLLMEFLPDKKSIVDFKGFAELIEGLWQRYLPTKASLQAAKDSLTGESWADRALIDAALLVCVDARNATLHRFIDEKSLPSALETTFSTEQLAQGYNDFNQICGFVEEKLNALQTSPFDEPLEGAHAFVACLQSAMLPFAVAKEPCCVRRAGSIALRLFERFISLNIVSLPPAVLFQRDPGFFRTLAGIAALFRFPANYADYNAVLQRAGLDKANLQGLFAAVCRLACTRFEAGLAVLGEDSLLYLLSAAELLHKSHP